jgi:hypothetical protein
MTDNMGYTRNEKSIIWLDSFSGFEYKYKAEILTLVKNPYEIVENLLKFKENIVNFSSDSVYNNMSASLRNEDYLQNILKEFVQKGITCVTISSSFYPQELKNSPAPPIILYCKGNLQLLKSRKFGIVGSRKSANSALKETEVFSKQLCKYFTIVSGLAEGGDYTALNSAIDGGNVISVLAYGFDYVYPESNRQLLDKLIERDLEIGELKRENKILREKLGIQEENKFSLLEYIGNNEYKLILEMPTNICEESETQNYNKDSIAEILSNEMKNKNITINKDFNAILRINRNPILNIIYKNNDIECITISSDVMVRFSNWYANWYKNEYITPKYRIDREY